MQEILKDAERRMEKSLDALRREFASIRAGRATPALLERIEVDYYGSLMPIQQLATVTIPEARQIVIQPWDKGSMSAIEKAIQKSDLNLTPNNDGNVIRLILPQLTEERRHELVRQVRKIAEEERVSIRNIRRDCNDALKQREKQGDISEDEVRRAQDDVQKLTDRFVKSVDSILEAKEAEILEV